MSTSWRGPPQVRCAVATRRCFDRRPSELFVSTTCQRRSPGSRTPCFTNLPRGEDVDRISAVFHFCATRGQDRRRTSILQATADDRGSCDQLNFERKVSASVRTCNEGIRRYTASAPPKYVGQRRLSRHGGVVAGHYPRAAERAGRGLASSPLSSCPHQWGHVASVTSRRRRFPGPWARRPRVLGSEAWGYRARGARATPCRKIPLVREAQSPWQVRRDPNAWADPLPRAFVPGSTGETKTEHCGPTPKRGAVLAAGQTRDGCGPRAPGAKRREARHEEHDWNIYTCIPSDT